MSILFLDNACALKVNKIITLLTIQLFMFRLRILNYTELSLKHEDSLNLNVVTDDARLLK